MNDIPVELILAFIGLIQFMLTTAFGFAWRAVNSNQKRAELDASDWEDRYNKLDKKLSGELAELRGEIEKLRNNLKQERDAKERALVERDVALRLKTEAETHLATEVGRRQKAEAGRDATQTVIDKLVNKLEPKKEVL